MHRATRWHLLVQIGLLVISLGLIAGALLDLSRDTGDPLASIAAQPSQQSEATPLVIPRPAGCDPWTGQAFAPDHVAVADVGTRIVQALPRTRDATGRIASPSPTDQNPSVFAWDNESGLAGEGNVLLTAHTYHDDRSALGNRLLAELQTGEMIRLEHQQHTLCYRVVRRVAVRVADYPVGQVYKTTAEQVVVTVCSGFDGSDWTRRTLWFAEPVK